MFHEIFPRLWFSRNRKRDGRAILKFEYYWFWIWIDFVMSLGLLGRNDGTSWRLVFNSAKKREGSCGNLNDTVRPRHVVSVGRMCAFKRSEQLPTQFTHQSELASIFSHRKWNNQPLIYLQHLSLKTYLAECDARQDKKKQQTTMDSCSE